MSGRFYAVRVTAGQEANVAKVASLKIQARKYPIHSLIIPPNLRGVIIVESDNVSTVKVVFQDIRHVKKIVFGTISFEEIHKMIEERKMEEEFYEGDIVEVISGPFRDMRAKITRVDREKKEAVIEFLDASFTLPVTITTDMLKLVKRREE
ncbi:transcription elongation factor Spt5 [Candidatus Geothermarchaeota archaeon]|nr:MAG: transcription elongation factor Spt5 [Candidatus Geothermarchaeota archaeon]